MKPVEVKDWQTKTSLSLDNSGFFPDDARSVKISDSSR